MDYDQKERDAFYEKGRLELEQLLKDENFRAMVYSIKIGDKVKTLEGVSWLNLEPGHVGVVTRVNFLNEDDPIPDHGTVEVDFGLGEDNREHWCHYNWWKYLEIKE